MTKCILRCCALTLLLICGTGFAKTSLTFNLTGISGDMLDNASKRLQIQVKSYDNLTPAIIKHIYANGDNDIKEALKPYGYFRAAVNQSGLTHQGSAWTANYQVSPGTPLKITSVNISIIGAGKKNKRILRALRHIKLKQGERFDVPIYNDTKNKLLNAAESTGYIKARFSEDTILIDRKKYTCIITLTFDTGSRYYFGPTYFSKNPLSDKFLQRFLEYKQGQPFSSDKLLTLQNDLGGTEYFKAVGVTPKLDQAHNYQIPIKVHLTPYKRTRYQFGLGYGTVTGPRVTAGIKWRWTNRWGHHFDTNVNWSRVNKQLSAKYYIPAAKPNRDQYILNAAIYTLNPRHGHAFVRQAGAGYQSNWNKWQRTINVNYMWETFKIDNQTGTREAHMLLPSLTYTWLSTNKLFNIKHGTRINFILEGTYKGLFSTVSFLQGQVQFKTVQTLWENNRFIFRTDLGYTIISNSDDLPLSERFYTGGPTSIRGFGDLSIGPGRYLTVASAEYQRRIVGNWFAAVFYDAGNAFNDFTQYAANLRRSTGVGVVWQSPIGNISVYLAKALTKKGQPISLDFSIGPEL